MSTRSSFRRHRVARSATPVYHATHRSHGCARAARAVSGLSAAGLLLVATGCAVVLGERRPAASEADFATLRPGMTSQAVRERFGPPTWIFGVRQERLMIWNYRFDPPRCVIYQVSVRPDQTVRDAGPTWDPACDGPSHSPP